MLRCTPSMRFILRKCPAWVIRRDRRSNHPAVLAYRKRLDWGAICGDRLFSGIAPLNMGRLPVRTPRRWKKAKGRGVRRCPTHTNLVTQICTFQQHAVSACCVGNDCLDPMTFHIPLLTHQQHLVLEAAVNRYVNRVRGGWTSDTRPLPTSGHPVLADSLCAFSRHSFLSDWEKSPKLN